MNRTLIPAVLVIFGSGSTAWAQGGSGNPVVSLFPDQDRKADGAPDLGEGGSWQGRIRFLIGGKTLDDDNDAWDPAEAQFEVAILADFAPAGWPVRLAADLRLGTSGGTGNFWGWDSQSTTLELNPGARWIIDVGSSASLCVGGGVSFGWGRIEVDDTTDSDSGFGYWLSFGFDISASQEATIGFDYGHTHVPVRINGQDADAGGRHVGFTVGFGF